jgi:hypothetical protein
MKFRGEAATCERVWESLDLIPVRFRILYSMAALDSLKLHATGAVWKGFG